MEMIFMTMENSKTNEAHKFIYNLLRILDLRCLNKPAALQNLFIYFTWKNIRQQYKNNKLRIITQTWNDEFQLPYYSLS